jgi:hypothetical protein
VVDFCVKYLKFCQNKMKAYEEIIDFFASGTTPSGISLFKASESTKQRVRELLRLEKQGIATSAEKTELDDFLRLEHLMRLTKARAKKYAES